MCWHSTALSDLFDYLAISEIVGVEKPDPRLFQAALDALAIAPADYGRVAMVGNNLERDIAGARRLGLITIFLHWNERRRTTPLTADETPDYTVHDAAELVALVERLAHRVRGTTRHVLAAHGLAYARLVVGARLFSSGSTAYTSRSRWVSRAVKRRSTSSQVL